MSSDADLDSGFGPRGYFFASLLNPFLHLGQQSRAAVDFVSQVYPQPGQVTDAIQYHVRV